jgi:CHASE3 domain sensor protein
VASVGNKTGVRTIINLGVNTSILASYNAIRKNIGREEDQLETLNKEKERLKEVGGGDRQMMQWKVKINAAVATKEARIKELTNELKAMEEEINKGNGAQAVITEMAYANTVFVISGVIYRLESDRKTYDKLIFKVDAKRENIVVI